MKIKLLLGVLAIGAVTALNSCKDDEVPVAGVDFELETQDVTESDGTANSYHPEAEGSDGVGRPIKVKLVFDIALAGDAVLEFDVDGTTRQTSNTQELSDFKIEAEGENLTVDGSQVTILKGSTEASFIVTIYEDGRLEFPDDDEDFTEDDIPFETIELTLERVVSGPIKLGTALKHTVRVLEDDTYVLIGWGVNNTQSAGDVDMDLWVYINDQFAFPVEDSDSQNPYEAFSIPAGIDNLKIGMRYIYKSGTADDVDFESLVANYGGTVARTNGTSDVGIVSAGSYTLANKYVSAEPHTTSQSMSKNGFNYTNLTDIVVPTSGSRTRNDATFRLDPRSIRKSKPVSVIKFLK
ncbi:MAG TPA: hypothetical protein VGD40_23350 [Chryseosolibacter sp.]